MTHPENSIYRVSPNAVFETFDDEVVIINMVSGAYFALDATARTIWTLAERGLSRDGVLQEARARYEGAAPAIDEAVAALLDDLEGEGLLVRAAANEAPGEAPVAPPFDGAKTPFAVPVVSKFTDMQDLLLLDPIHEVDEQGWPFAKPAPAP